MRILLIMDPGIPVPPQTYGGHERLVYMFAEEYTRLGHQVSLLAGPDSRITGRIFPFGENNLNRSKLQRTKELISAWRFLSAKRNEFDIIHNFGRLAYLLPVLNSKVHKIMSYGRPVAQSGIKLFNTLANQHLTFTACSNYCVSTGNVAGRWETVYNAIDFSKYALNTAIDTGAPLMFLGRMDKIKGLHNAIEVAIASNHKLWIGGNIPTTADNLAYYENEIAPKIDGKQIVYLGPLTDNQKSDYLGKAKALLFPIEWDEPFGMVMVEAMACGTPVIGFRRGSVPEVVDEGITGFVVDTNTEMIEALNNVAAIDRHVCRTRAESRFDVSVIAKNYLSLID